MKIFYQLPTYKSDINVIEVYDSEHSVIGTLQRYGNNQEMEKVVRHLSSTFVSNIRAQDSKSTVLYTLQLKNQVKAFISTAEWTIEKNNQTIGSIKEKGAGRTLVMELPEERIKAVSDLTSLREIKFFLIEADQETLIGTGKRNSSITSPQMNLDVNEEGASVPLILLAALSFAHNNQGK